MGREHLRNLALIPGATVTALADPDDASMSTARDTLAPQATAFRTAGDLIGSGLCDAVVIASPNDTHKSNLEAIFASGSKLPVLVEKPLCTSAEDCRWLSKACADHPAPIWVGMEYRFMPAVQEMQAKLRAGVAGSPRMIAIREHRHPFLTKVNDWNRFSHRTGGTLVEKCCHFLDLMRMFANDEPVRIYASGAMDENHLDESYDGARPDILDNAFVIVDFRNGARAALDLCMFADGVAWEQEYSVTGGKARVDCLIPARHAYARGVQAQVIVSNRNREETREYISIDPAVMTAGAHSGATYHEHLAFRRAILGQGQIEVGVPDGLRAVAMGLAAELSAREHRPVEIDGIEFG